MADWYKRYPGEYVGGVVGLGPDVIGCYSVVLDLIYQDGDSCPNDPGYIGGILGCNGRKAAALIQACVKHGKLQLRDDGRLVNSKARQVLEERATVLQQARDNGATGGRRSAEKLAALKKNNNLAAATLDHLEERRGEEKRKEDSPPPKPSQPSLLADASETIDPKKNLKAEFEEFYSAFPRHVGRADAERAYARARRTADAAAILEGAKRYAYSRRAEDPKFTAHPATWLNAGRWLDEIATAGGAGAVIFQQTDVNGWVERLKVFHHGQEADENGTFGYSIPAGTWATTYGPKPGQPGCKVPPEASTRYQDWLARSRTGKDRLQG